jgi:hypothetical protein
MNDRNHRSADPRSGSALNPPGLRLGTPPLNLPKHEPSRIDPDPFFSEEKDLEPKGKRSKWEQTILWLFLGLLLILSLLAGWLLMAKITARYPF